MQGNRSAETKPEIALRRELVRHGLRGYRKNFSGIIGRPDVAFTRNRLAVFVHGCYWHRCPRCKLPLPKTNKNYWTWKFRRNRARDKRVAKVLERSGWRVLVLWACEVTVDAGACAERVQDDLRQGA